MHFTIKPVSFSCNLNCDYCFYLPKGEDFLERGRMSDEVLATFVRRYIQENQSSTIFFTWQGGEPLLAGIEFYRKAFDYQNKYNTSGKTIENAIQTNATLITDEWCELFKEHKILVGVSIDGPEEIHDKYRKDNHQKGSFKEVMKGIELLKKHNIPFNTLTCISEANYQKPLEVYHFLKDIGSTYMQFSEVVETTPENTDFEQIAPSYKIKPFAIPATAYGKFMGDIFMEWIKNDIGQISVRQFESFMAMFMGMGHVTCVFEPTCCNNFVIEANGDIYECDQAVYSKYRLANVMDCSFKLSSLEAKQLQAHKAKLSKECKKCDYIQICNGGCVKHRIDIASDGVAKTYFCAGYKEFFKRVVPYFNALASLAAQRVPFNVVKDLIPQIEQAISKKKK